jgi:GT2 family glycosyltransferase
MEQGLVAASDMLISPSRYMIAWMREQGWALPPRQVVLPNLIPVGAPESSVDAAADANAMPLRKAGEIVFFGRIEPRKGLLIFCDAIDRIAGELGPDIKLTFLGKTLDGEYGKGLLAARFRKWQIRWQVIDDLNTFEARQYLAGEGRLAVIPSLADNSPYTVLECLTWKVPFIASRVGGVMELIHPDDCERVLFKPTPADLAAKLRRVLAEGIVPARLAFSHRENLAKYLQLHSGPIADLCDQSSIPAEAVTDDPLVTVCLLHHERPSELAGAVASLQCQTYRNIEVVLVDNGSTSSAARAALVALEPAFAARHWQIVRLAENMYEPFARNQAAHTATGKYVLFMDDDNVAKENEVETFVRVAARTDAQVLTCFLDHFDTPDPPSHESQARKRFIPIGDAGPVGLIYNGYGDVNCFVERHAFLRVGGFVEDGGFNHAEDWRFLARAYAAGLRMSVVPEALVWYRTSAPPSNTSWRKRDRSGALMRVAAAYLEHAPKLVQPFLLLAQGLFWKAVESEARVRELDRLHKSAEQRARSLQSHLVAAERRYQEMLSEYRKLESLLQHAAKPHMPDPAALQRMQGAVAVGRRRHFGLTDQSAAPDEPQGIS